MKHEKLIVLYGIASAMLFLHDHNIIHRDLKPDNILMRISDFGLSKIEHKSQESMSLQSTAGIKGTPLYLAPEAISNSIYSKPGDVYSFAFIAYEILTNKIPFLGINLYTLMDNITSGKRPEFKSPINEPYKKLN